MSWHHGDLQVAGALLQHAASLQQLAACLQGQADSLRADPAGASFRDQMSSEDYQQLSNLGQFLPMLDMRMQSMEKLVRSNQAPSRILKWLTTPD